MKTKILISLLILVITGGFLLVKEETGFTASPPPSSIPDNEFVICALDAGGDVNYDVYPDWGFNTWHKYGDLLPGWPRVPNDRYDNPPSVYGSALVTNITDNRGRGFRTVMDRPKTQYLAFGQRSDYQCEPDNFLSDPDYSFYTYNTHETGNPIIDYNYNSVRVMHCRTMPANPSADEPGYVVSGLKANREQANRFWNWWMNDDTWNWYVMPKIRADANYINNNANWEEPVCRIDVLNWDGNPVPAFPNGIVLRAKHFRFSQSTQYNGEYIDKFHFIEFQDPTYIQIPAGEICPGPKKDFWEWDNVSIQTDFRVYWYGNCDMWIDYVRVENQPAHDLFFNPLWETWLRQEVNIALTGYNPSDPKPNFFYMEEFEFNCTPCIKKVNEIIEDQSLNRLTLAVNFNNDLYAVHIPHFCGYILSADKVKKFLVDYAGIDILATVSYNLEGWDGTEPGRADFISKNPNTLPLYATYTGDYDRDLGILAYKTSPADYDNWLQDRLDNKRICAPLGESYIGIMKKGQKIEKLTPGLRIMNLHQSHLWWKSGHKLKEPTNEELEVMANIPVTYGVKGILYFWMGNGGEFTDPVSYNRGFTNPSPNYFDIPREYNVYGQRKWDKVKEINGKLTKWGPTLMSFDGSYTNSYIYRLERTECLSGTYLSDIVTYYPTKLPSQDCLNDAPGEDPPLNWQYDCIDNRYLQVATFKKEDGSDTPYFMIVNRRCSPHLDKTTIDRNGGLRDIRVKFDTNPPELTGFNEWVIKDVANEDWEQSFNKTQSLYVDLGEFMPGEGRLYYLVPKVKSGGTLVGDEYVSAGEEFTCEDTVWTNGYNLTIENGVTIHFSDSAKFVVEGGTFQLGDPGYEGVESTEMDGESGTWKGFEFVEANVKIYSTEFSGLANDSISMLTMIDCPLVDLRDNTFALGTGSNKGAIDISCVSDAFEYSNIYIGYNTFDNSSTALPYVKVIAYSGFTTPVIIESNNITGTSTAIFLSNIQGGVVKSNTISGFGNSLIALSSSIDVYNNTITSTPTGTYGINALSGTELKMSYADGYYVGGRNNITNSGTDCYNIYVEDSYFLMDEGENIFDIGDDSYHLYGWFPESYSGAYEETENCFKVESSVVDPPVEYVTLGEQGYQITNFEFTPYLAECTIGGEGDFMVINLGNDIYDTLMYEGQGQGGAISSEKAKVKSEKWIRNLTGFQNLSGLIVTPKAVYDSLCIQMRFRNYANVKSLCLYLLNTYPDSMQSLGAVSKLYLAVSKTDTTTQGITDLKTIYENLILNHSNNVSLVKRCNYYVQKCKVLLHQYSSALTGFQQIINNNPASYEGLVARWDYMATSLMMQGQGGSEEGKSKKAKVKKYSIPLWGGVDVPMSIGTDGVGPDDDRSPFSREERKQIKQTVTTALEISKSTEKQREKVLTELSTRGDVKATKQLKVLKSLEQTVKVEKPKNIAEHLKIVAGDIQKVFVNPNAGKNTNTAFIPTAFNLSQNYPNPFNPVTKINYDIPKNSIVKLTIYDILGREVIKLVNNELKQPGRYVVEFNGTNFASGVYFYRIEVRQAGSSTVDYVNSKKMVFVK